MNFLPLRSKERLQRLFSFAVRSRLPSCSRLTPGSGHFFWGGGDEESLAGPALASDPAWITGKQKLPTSLEGGGGKARKGAVLSPPPQFLGASQDHPRGEALCHGGGGSSLPTGNVVSGVPAVALPNSGPFSPPLQTGGAAQPLTGDSGPGGGGAAGEKQQRRPPCNDKAAHFRRRPRACSPPGLLRARERG